MTDKPTAPKPPSRPRPPAKPPGQTKKTSRVRPSEVAFGKIASNVGRRVGLYGPGGIGKTTLAAMTPGPVAFFDLDDSLPVLASQLPEGLDLRVIDDARDWQGMRDMLHAPGWDKIRTIAIDSATKAQELCVAWVLANVPGDNGQKIERLEDYGWGKGYTHVYEAFLTLLGDLDSHVRAGRNVLLTMHDCTSNVPNPTGNDWIRFEPRLQAPSSGKASIRLRVREWLDHLLFVGYDVAVNKDGKAQGAGSRTMYPVELPHCMAKSRSLYEPRVVEFQAPATWEGVFGG